jgi:hypothetical protein
MKVAPLLAALLCPVLAMAERINSAEDDTGHSGYDGGWNDGVNPGIGFGPWVQKVSGMGPNDSHAGFFMGFTDRQDDLDHIAVGGRALGIFANGLHYEVAAAFRAFDQPLGPGDAFSLAIEGSDFYRKFDSDDSRPGAVGFALRTGNAQEMAEDYEAGMRMKFARVEGEQTYQVFDGEEATDTGVSVTDKGVMVTVVLTGPDTYDLEITTMEDNNLTKLEGRKLAGDAGATLDSFAVFNADGERGDAYFNSFQVSKEASP